jgi:hypothetical protein
VSGILCLFLLAAPQGLAPDWELKPNVLRIAQDSAPLRPLLEQLDPAKWETPGGPSAYQAQLRESLQAIDDLHNAAARLAENPSKLTVALETLLRLEHLVARVQSIAEGVRRYQNPAVAEILEGVLAAPLNSRDWLRTHVSEVAATREKELEVAQKEADKCRAQIQRQGSRK